MSLTRPFSCTYEDNSTSEAPCVCACVCVCVCVCLWVCGHNRTIWSGIEHHIVSSKVNLLNIRLPKVVFIDSIERTHLSIESLKNPYLVSCWRCVPRSPIQKNYMYHTFKHFGSCMYVRYDPKYSTYTSQEAQHNNNMPANTFLELLLSLCPWVPYRWLTRCTCYDDVTHTDPTEHRMPLHRGHHTGTQSAVTRFPPILDVISVTQGKPVLWEALFTSRNIHGGNKIR